MAAAHGRSAEHRAGGHARAAGEHQVDCGPSIGSARAACSAPELVAQLQHVAKDGEPPAAALGPSRPSAARIEAGLAL